MSDESSGLVEAPRRFQRILGRVSGDAEGPVLVALAGIHGNEQAGIEAARSVLAELARRRAPLAGELLLLAGNLPALELNSRFIDHDLNRQWTPEKISALGSNSRADDPSEHAEQRELLATLREVAEAAQGPVYFVDLHTCSADGPPFVTVGDTLRNRRLAQAFPLPLILGLEEQVDGALLELLNNYGFVTMGVEAGRHDDPDSAPFHEAVLWLALVNAGLLKAGDAPGLDRHLTILRAAARGAPAVVEVRYRHGVAPEDRFRMEPGFSNFDVIRKGQVLAHDRNGPIPAPESGRILLPLYQGLGNDGFFICREVRPFWLRVSAVLRRLRLNRLVPLLPGVRRHPESPDVLIVNTRVARIYPLEIFHLFGFRKIRQVGLQVMFSRRRYDLAPPRRISMT